MHVFGDAEALGELERVFAELVAEALDLDLRLCALLGADEAVLQEEHAVGNDPIERVQGEELTQGRLDGRTGRLDCQLELAQGHVLAPGGRQRLHVVRLAVHPRVEYGRLVLARHEHLAAQLVDEKRLARLEERPLPLARAHVGAARHVIGRLLFTDGQRAQLQVLADRFEVDRLEELFGDLLLNDAVVALSSDARVHAGDALAEAVGGQEALAAAALATRARRVLAVPRHERLDNATQTNHFGMIGLALVGEAILHVVERKVERIRLSDERHEGAILQLIVQYGRVRLARRTDAQARGRVAHRLVEQELDGAHGHRGDAHATREQLVGEDDEALAASSRLVVNLAAQHRMGTMCVLYMFWNNKQYY